MGTPQIIQGQGNPVMTNLRKNIQMIGQFMLQKKLKEKDEDKKIKDALELYKKKLKIKQDYPEQPSVSTSVTPYSLTEKIKASQILGATPGGLAGTKGKKNDLSGYTQMGDTTVPGGELGPLGGIQKFFGGTPTPRQVPSFTPDFNVLKSEAQNVASGPGKVSQRVSYGRGAAPALGAGAATADEATINKLKPDDIPQSEWDTHSVEEKIEFLQAAGLL